MVLVLVGLLALQMSLTDAMLTFLRPGMRPWLVGAGATLVVLGGVSALGRRGGSEDHSHNVQVGWLLLVPLCVGILAPTALDARAAQRASAWRRQAFPSRPFDLDAYLRANALSGGTPRLPLVDYVNAVSTHRAYLEAHPIRLIGFVTSQPHGGNRFLLTRFLVGCCAADAFPMQIEVHTLERPPAADTWVEVTVRLASEPRARRDQERRDPVLLAQSLHKVSKPSEPYEYPG
jgi:uncharacterized repeat protein (TIGR03943 family)